jgi:hypothetical protein
MLVVLAGSTFADVILYMMVWCRLLVRFVYYIVVDLSLLASSKVR